MDGTTAAAAAACLLLFVATVTVADAVVRAGCTIESGSGSGTVNGPIEFIQEGDTVTIKVNLREVGEPNTKHAFHIHEHGDIGNNCYNSGDHYNPLNSKHGGPTTPERHVGDLGNILADANGSTITEITDDVISLTGQYSIVNRTVDVHINEDDLGIDGGNGNSGSRTGCCVVQFKGVLDDIGGASGLHSRFQGVVLTCVLVYLLQYIYL